MKNRAKKILSGIAVLVIGGVILANIGAIWRTVVDSLKAVWGFLGSSLTLPMWLVILVGLVALLAIGFCVLVVWTAKTNQPSHLNYQQDEFFDVTWRWAYYSDGTVNEDALWCFCPKCETMIVYEIDNYNGIIKLSCETCQQEVGTYSGSRSHLRGRIARQIDRKIRTREWREVITRHQLPKP
jgi:hypothetical protein